MAAGAVTAGEEVSLRVDVRQHQHGRPLTRQGAVDLQVARLEKDFFGGKSSERRMKSHRQAGGRQPRDRGGQAERDRPTNGEGRVRIHGSILDQLPESHGLDLDSRGSVPEGGGSVQQEGERGGGAKAGSRQLPRRLDQFTRPPRAATARPAIPETALGAGGAHTVATDLWYGSRLDAPGSAGGTGILRTSARRVSTDGGQRLRDSLIAPHGGQLMTLLVDGARAAELKRASIDWPSWDLTPRQMCDLEMLLSGGFSPLGGFMGRGDYESVCSRMRLEDGTLRPIPITLDVPETFARGLEAGTPLGLRDPEGILLAVLHLSTVWQADLEAETQRGFGGTRRQHPGGAQPLDQSH